FVPLWRIELDAPQYPEGLKLSIFANKLGGDVEIINGLNHYIGMNTLHAEEFPEFTFLPYLLALFGVFAIVAGILRNRAFLLFVALSFILFGLLAIIDFWYWEYVYGHNLNPNAAIIVPGMAYQPPLIGFKQLLNFGAFSIPDIGGWLLLVAGVLIVAAVALSYGWFTKKYKNATYLLFGWMLLNCIACQTDAPEAIRLNKDNCHLCKMTIVDGQFGTEIITQKGKVFKFDDMRCMLKFKEENPKTAIKGHYVHNFLSNNELIPAESAFYLHGGSIHSPMSGNIAAFKSTKDAEANKATLSADIATWEQLSSISE
ncbi:MAG: nitrous oxide reductase accessory protein NosL, partial [Saprospiraceae bacterium]|nr:nitrous oxide reductase accessory protein NosL [Saprospiraceae bacterium]